MRHIRKKAHVSVEDLSNRLKDMGYAKVSKQTLYGYENKVSMPNADVFLDICYICNCQNPLTYWKEIYDAENNEEEQAIIDAYRKLKPSQKDMVLNLLSIDKQNVISGESSDSGIAI